MKHRKKKEKLNHSYSFLTQNSKDLYFRKIKILLREKVIHHSKWVFFFIYIYYYYYKIIARIFKIQFKYDAHIF